MPPGDLIPARGRAADSIMFSIVRSLTAEDLVRAAAGRNSAGEHAGPVTVIPPLQKISARHHIQARLCAEGKTHIEVALLTHTTPQRIGQLVRDPTFRELVDFFRDQADVAGLEDSIRIQGKMVIVAEEALDEITNRLEDDTKRDRIPIGELRALVEMGADRTVAPPKAAQQASAVPTHITFNIAGRGLTPPGATIEGTISDAEVEPSDSSRDLIPAKPSTPSSES